MQTNEEVVYLYLDDIIPNRFQPREVFDERPLKELAVSIKEHGVIQPIIVRKVNDKYETKITGLYAVGDNIKKDYYQIITAMAEGAVAALNVCESLN